MANYMKTERNKDLIKRRKKNPKKWTWGQLAEHFGISRATALQIYQRYHDKY